MGSIVVVASSKGGCAKTTCTIALAVNMAARGYKVAVCDSDPNQSFLAWHQNAEAPALTVTSCTHQDEIVGHLMGLAETHHVVLADTGGWMNQTTVFAFGPADFVVIPCMADRGSVIEARRTARQIETISQIARRPIPYRLLLTRWTPRGLAERATLADIEESGLSTFKQHIPALSVFQKATFSGDMPHTGFIGLTISKVIDELVGLEAIPAESTREKAT